MNRGMEHPAGSESDLRTAAVETVEKLGPFVKRIWEVHFILHPPCTFALWRNATTPTGPDVCVSHRRSGRSWPLGLSSWSS